MGRIGKRLSVCNCGRTLSIQLYLRVYYYDWLRRGGWMTVVIECTYSQSRLLLREIPRMKQPLVFWSWLVNKCIRCVRYSLKVRQGLRMSRLANMNLCCKHSKYMTNTVSHLDTVKTNGYRGRKIYRFHCKISTSTVKLIQVWNFKAFYYFIL